MSRTDFSQTRTAFTRRTLAGGLAALVLATAALHHPANHEAASAATPPGQVMFGAETAVRGTQTRTQAFASFEASIDRKLALTRVYKRWDDGLGNPTDVWMRDGGRTFVLSVVPKRKDGSRISWREIADAPAGSPTATQVVRWAQSVKTFGAPTYFVFHHEPDTTENAVHGTPEDFKAAWRRVVSTFRAEGVPNVRFLWTLTGYTFGRSETDPRAAANFYPGDDVVDEIGGDGYNSFGCNPSTNPNWTSFAEVYEGMRAFGELHPTKGLFAPEFGSVEDPAVPGRKGQWFADAAATLKSPGWEQFKAVLYWSNEGDPTVEPDCEYWVDSTPSSLAGYRAMGADPHFSLWHSNDATAPELTGLGLSPSVINTAIGAQTVRVDVSATDDFAGVDHACATLTSPLGLTSRSSCASTLVSGALRQGTWQVAITLPQNSEVGAWTVRHVNLHDTAANVRHDAVVAGPGATAPVTVEVGTAAVPPTPPTGATADAGNRFATVSWTAPASNGGSPVTGYSVVASPGGATTTAPAGATSAVVPSLTNGTAYTFTVKAANAAGTSVPSLRTAAVTPAGTTPTVRVTAASADEGDAGTTAAEVAVTLSDPVGVPVEVDYATADASAVAGADYTAATGTVTFAPAQTVATIAVPVRGDVLDEADEAFNVALSNPAGATLAAASSARVTVVDDDDLPALAIAGAAVVEPRSGTVAVALDVTLSAPSGRGVNVAYATADGTATAPGDYVAETGNVYFAPGETQAQVWLAAKADLAGEGDERFTVTLSNPASATIATARATVTLSDPVPTVSVGDVTLTEGTGGAPTANFAVTLSSGSATPVTVAVATTDGSARAGADYTATSTTVTFGPNERTKTVSVPVAADALDEPDENFKLVLSNPVGATVADGWGTANVVDDDDAPAISIDDVSVTEGNSGTRSARFTVTLSAPSGRSVSASFATRAGTATAGSDFVAATGTVNFPAGTTTRSVYVTTNADTANEANETFSVVLSAPVAATLADATGVATVVDDD